MQYSVFTHLLAFDFVYFWKLTVLFSTNPSGIEQIVLRWVHIVAGITWVGFL